jgi:hypothetical protein
MDMICLLKAIGIFLAGFLALLGLAGIMTLIFKGIEWLLLRVHDDAADLLFVFGFLALIIFAVVRCIMVIYASIC